MLSRYHEIPGWVKRSAPTPTSWGSGKIYRIAEKTICKHSYQFCGSLVNRLSIPCQLEVGLHRKAYVTPQSHAFLRDPQLTGFAVGLLAFSSAPDRADYDDEGRFSGSRKMVIVYPKKHMDLGGLSMSLRWKFLIILLVFSLTPLLVYAYFGQREMISLGDTISDLLYRSRTLGVSKELELLASEYARTFKREREFLDLVLTVFAEGVERVLNGYPRTTSKAYVAANFDDPLESPADLVQPSTHKSMSTRSAYQVFNVSRGVAPEKAGTDSTRLAELLPLQKLFAQALPNILYRQYVVLPNGAHALFPGHGRYPRNLPVLNELVSRVFKGDRRVVWSRPYTDEFSAQVIMTGSVPVRRPDGSLAGIASMDALISGLFRATDSSSLWSQYVRAFLACAEVDPKTDALVLNVVAAKNSQQASAAWSGVHDLQPLSLLENQGTNRLVKQFEANKSGYLDMPYERVDSLWAYASLGEDTFLVLIVPKEKILVQSELARDRILWLTHWQWLETAIIAVSLTALLTLLVFWRSRTLIRPFLVMAEAVQRLAEGDFSARMEIRKGDERDLVAKAFNEMVPQLADRVQCRNALEIAHEVQQNLLPGEVPQLPGFDIAGKLLYCEETGGDYFDFVRYGRKSDQLGIAVGDVTGHGIGAALLMTTARAHIRNLSTKQDDLAEHIATVNRLLATDVRHSGNFVSLFFLELQAGSRTIRWVRAGHDPGLLFDPVAKSFEELAGSGLVLGVAENYSYTQYEKLVGTPGTIIFIGTDGIWETHNGHGEMFGKRRLCDIIRANHGKSAEEIQDAVLEALREFRGDVPQEDDVTIVVAKVE
ncbi:MAG TPA: SpoIIE family protein phosphatase [Syntrophobacteria bacterium]|nr:SpoIIE family protein phosphatase [Syntrophobacteria bacterium]